MKTFPTHQRLRAHFTRLQAMLDDPECTDDLLLVGIALLQHITAGTAWNTTYVKIAEPVFASRAYLPGGVKIKTVLRGDIRRYEIDHHEVVTCPVPMQRREGLCGQKVRDYEYRLDPMTGERHRCGVCSRADHQQWFKEDRARHRASLEGRIIPTPCANTGGVLARHFREIDWEAAWKRWDPKWEKPPERDPVPVSEEPKFRLVLGEGNTDDGDADAPRVSLTIIGDE